MNEFPQPLIFDDRACQLGEGPLWHPGRQQLFWFDILNKRLLTRENNAQRHWQFDQNVSAAGWIDNDNLLIATETGLDQFNLTTGTSLPIAALEEDNPVTRSNDGRADPWGGFWIGTMGKNTEKEAGAIYRYYRGEVRKLFPDITIPNSICFAPDGKCAYFTDTIKQIIWRQKLANKDGWPEAEPELFIDLRSDGLFPDGSIVDSAGYLLNAQWGAAQLSRYDADGKLESVLKLPAKQVTCPALGGCKLDELYITSAADKLDLSRIDNPKSQGQTFVVRQQFQGQAEHQILL